MDRVGERPERPRLLLSSDRRGGGGIEGKRKKERRAAESTRARSIGCQVVTDVISQTNPPERPSSNIWNSG